ncbi:hypothetical protein D3C86_981080 [compost metagenome]
MTVTWVAYQRLEAGTVSRDVQVAGVDLDAVVVEQCRGAPGHQPRGAKHLPCLLLSGGAGVDLGTEFVICREAVEANRSGECRLAVLAGDLVVYLAKATQTATLAHPAEHAADDEQLPRLEVQGLTLEGPLPLGVGHELDELGGPLGFVLVKTKPELGRLLFGQIIEMTLAGLDHVAAGWDVATHHIAGVAIGHVDVGIAFACGHSPSLQSSERVASSLLLVAADQA